MGGEPLVEEQVFAGRGWWHRLRAVVVEPEGVRFVRRWGGDALLTWDELHRLTWRDRRELVLHTHFHEWVIGPHIERLRDLAEAIGAGRHQSDAPAPTARAGAELREKLARFGAIEALPQADRRGIGLRDLSGLERFAAVGVAGLVGAALLSSGQVGLAALAFAATLCASLAGLIWVRRVAARPRGPGPQVPWRVELSDDTIEVSCGGRRQVVRWDEVKSYDATVYGLAIRRRHGGALHIPPLDEFAPLIDAARPAARFMSDAIPVPDSALSRMKGDSAEAASRGISRSGRD